MVHQRSLNVHKVALAIYLFGFAFGICFATKASAGDCVVELTTVTVQLFDGNAEGNGQDTDAKKRFGSQFPGEEDDDDSARELVSEQVSNHSFVSRALRKSGVGFVSNPQNIHTPPPR